uniref:FAT domain-containing protein n=1 Tax=Emiliania huxleyi (strain CCMP1516) TaxID=280463 RepID=A0A0D3I9A8_EMIH1
MLELLRVSPAQPLRACLLPAQAYPPLAQELLNAAFLSCWSQLTPDGCGLLAAAVEAALERESMPPAVLQKMLNLADFMELHLQPLPIPVRKLGSLAERCQAYAKAAHYREMSFTHAAFRHAASLISINNQLQLPEAAAGVLAFSRDLGVEPRVSWYEKLGRWSDALAAYDRMSQSAEGGAAGGSIAVRLGSMRCLHALGEWRRLCQLASEAWLDPALDASGGESTLTPAPGSLHPS